MVSIADTITETRRSLGRILNVMRRDESMAVKGGDGDGPSETFNIGFV